MKERRGSMRDDGEDELFESESDDEENLSAATYYVIIGLVLGWGFLINWIIVSTIPITSWVYGVHPFIFLGLYFASCLLGIYIFRSSPDPALSFIGYNFVVVPFGLVMNIIVGRTNPTVVLQAILVTALVTMLLMILGALFPDIFENISSALTAALFGVLVIELGQIFIFHAHPGWIDWVVAVIFCGYIGFSLARAYDRSWNADNAIDSAAEIYMDIINLFLRILRIKGRR